MLRSRHSGCVVHSRPRAGAWVSPGVVRSLPAWSGGRVCLWCVVSPGGGRVSCRLSPVAPAKAFAPRFRSSPEYRLWGGSRGECLTCRGNGGLAAAVRCAVNSKAVKALFGNCGGGDAPFRGLPPSPPPPDPTPSPPLLQSISACVRGVHGVLSACCPIFY